MEYTCEEIDGIRQELKKANAEVERLSKNITDVVNDKEKSAEMSNGKIARLETNVKMLEGQIECVVSEKFNATRKLSEVEDRCEEFQRELKQLKRKNKKQEVKINILKQEIDSFNEKKGKMFSKFNLLKSQEKVHDVVLGAIKREFEQQIVDLMAATSTSLAVASSTNVGTEENLGNIVMESISDDVEIVELDEEVDPPSAETTSGRDHNLTTEAFVEVRTKVSSYEHSIMRRTSGTKINRSKTVTSNTRKFTKIKHPADMNHRSKTEGVMERRPKRILTCTSCSKRYQSTPARAFCECKYIDFPNDP